MISAEFLVDELGLDARVGLFPRAQIALEVLAQPLVVKGRDDGRFDHIVRGALDEEIGSTVEEAEQVIDQ